jgi:ribonuclease BN (tRNA processing enzyme)
MSSLTLRILGSGTVAPSPTRTSAAYWVETGDVRLLMDCGAGTLHRAAAFGIPWHTVTHIALTHFHADHWGELPAYLFALKWGVEPARTAPLRLLAPRGIRERLGHLARALDTWVLEPGYPLEIVELEPGIAVALSDEVQLETHRTPHTDESLALAVRRGSARLVYTGDTGTSSELAGWARGCQLLLAECSLPDNRALAIHLTPSQAGRLAREAGAKSLVLTHFYPPVDVRDAVRVAAAAFGGPVTAAEDGDRFLIEA